jgi:hypothetical protein
MKGAKIYVNIFLFFVHFLAFRSGQTNLIESGSKADLDPKHSFKQRSTYRVFVPRKKRPNTYFFIFSTVVQRYFTHCAVCPVHEACGYILKLSLLANVS